LFTKKSAQSRGFVAWRGESRSADRDFVIARRKLARAARAIRDPVLCRTLRQNLNFLLNF